MVNAAAGPVQRHPVIQLVSVCARVFRCDENSHCIDDGGVTGPGLIGALMGLLFALFGQRAKARVVTRNN